MADADNSNPVADDLFALFDLKDQDGNYLFNKQDYLFTRKMFLMEVAKEGTVDMLDDDGKLELFMMLAQMGIGPATADQDATPAVAEYFASFDITPLLLEKVVGILEKHFVGVDSVDGQDWCAEAYKKLQEKEIKAPELGAKAPDDAKSAQDLAQQYGIKLKI